MKKHPSHAAPVVARAHALSPARMRTSSPGCRRCRSGADAVAGALKFGMFVKKHPSHAPPVVTRAQTLSPGRMHCRPRACVLARAQAFPPGHRRCRPRRPCLGPNLRGYKRPRLPFSPHFPSIRSFLAWTCPPAAPCENLTNRTFLIVLFVYVNCISVPFITFIFLITSVRSTCLAACKNREAEERDKGVGAMVYVATGWTYAELCVLWKHNAIQKRTGL